MARPPHNGMMVVAWETTKRCPLKCKHCRANASAQNYADELSLDEGKRMIDGLLKKFPSVMLILSGGEPMARSDIYDLARYATAKNVRVVMSPCGPSLNAETVAMIKDAGVQCISVSVDGADAETHDAFRGIPGIYAQTLRGLAFAREGGLPFQINSTITRLNAEQIPQMLANAVALGAIALDLFFLVPTGRGKDLASFALDPDASEATLHRVVELQKSAPIPIRVTCAPHWVRIQDQMDTPQMPMRPGGSKGCLAGKNFLFVSHRGIVQPCGFLQLNCGDLRAVDFDFETVFQTSEVLQKIQSPENYKGACGHCFYKARCGGCRARAYEATGDYLEAEPYCQWAKKHP